jgi:hypothetical protein
VVAFVAADGIRDFDGDHGWGIEAWAQCDPAELPARVTDALGIEVWQDRAGRRVPVSRVQSFRGPEHCGWQDVTFLRIGADERREYVRDTSGGLDDLLRSTYDGTARLPAQARATGYRRHGRELWLDPGSAAYLVRVGDRRDVERWPATREPIRCA